MNYAKPLLIALFFNALVGSSALSAPAKPVKQIEPAATTEKGLLFRQKSHLVGRGDLLITKSGFKLVMPEKELELLMTAPKWQLRLVNMRDKLYFDADRNAWTPREDFTSALYRSVNFRLLRLVKKEPATLQELPTILMHLVGEQYPKDRPLGKWERLAVKNADYWGYKDERLNPATIALMERIYCMPATGYLPLQLKGLNNKNSPLDELTLTSVTKVNSTAADFQLGKEYKAAKSESQVLTNSSAGSMLTDFAAE